jgi:hypothetical protein
MVWQTLPHGARKGGSKDYAGYAKVSAGGDRWVAHEAAPDTVPQRGDPAACRYCAEHRERPASMIERAVCPRCGKTRRHDAFLGRPELRVLRKGEVYRKWTYVAGCAGWREVTVERTGEMWLCTVYGWCGPCRKRFETDWRRTLRPDYYDLRQLAMRGMRGEKERLLTRQKKCHICGRRFSRGAPRDLDHVIALYVGGTSAPSNLALAHPSCNASKSTLRFNHLTGQGWLL